MRLGLATKANLASYPQWDGEWAPAEGSSSSSNRNEYY